jgi:valine--pyruvate aminotransferase
MKLSLFGEKLTGKSGILALMDDLGRALSGSEPKLMLGGGNPAHVDEVNSVWRARMHEILSSNDEFERMLANYDTPQGNPRFLEGLAGLLRREFGWNVTSKNIAVTNGSQTAFYLLFNMLSGPSAGGARRKILFPLMPEYIGYADQSSHPQDFVTFRPRIEEIGEHRFKYHVDFERLEIASDVAAICVSRPTNPTGNVLTDDELSTLDGLAREHDIPLIVDNAYGTPFPNIIFERVTPMWNSNTVVGMSLSKIGLPSTRTGILVADEELASAVSAGNAVLSLANTSVGQIITAPLLENGELLRLSNEVIRPFYEAKRDVALSWIDEFFRGIDYAVHKSEGSIFLWMWFRSMEISTKQLYERLKRRNVIVVPGEYFFYGLDEEWDHATQCIRLNYSRSEEEVREGLRVIAEEVRSAEA